MLYYVCVEDADIFVTVVTADALFFLSYFTFPRQFAFASPLWKQRVRIKTLTQCAKWSQFAVDYFLW